MTSNVATRILSAGRMWKVESGVVSIIDTAPSFTKKPLALTTRFKTIDDIPVRHTKITK
jgi:hypothetical protein